MVLLCVKGLHIVRNINERQLSGFFFLNCVLSVSYLAEMLILCLPCVRGPVASAGGGLEECCWCGRVQVALAALCQSRCPGRDNPRTYGRVVGGSVLLPCSTGAAGTCHELKESFYGSLLGEGRQKWGRRAVSQGGSWSGSCCECKGGSDVAESRFTPLVSLALNKRFPLGGFYGEVQRAVKSLVQFPIVAALFLVISTL